MLKSIQSFLLLLILAFFSFAQTTPTPSPTPKKNDVGDDDEVIKINSKLVVVPVSVTDIQGQPVSGLKITDFRVLEENKPQEIAEIGAAEEVPLEIAVLLDVSGSIDPMYKFEQETAAQFLRGVMKDRDRASLFTISEKPALEISRDTAEKVAAKILSMTTARRTTAFFDTITYAANYLQKNAPPNSRKVIIVISDGEDNYSEMTRDAEIRAYQTMDKEINTLTPERKRKIMAERDAVQVKAQNKVLKDLQNADVVFYSVNPAGNSYQLNVISKRGQENMKKFSDETGGTAFLPKKADDLTSIFRRISSELRAQYLLQYYPEADFAAGKYVTLQVSLPNGPQYRVRARRGYFVKN